MNYLKPIMKTHGEWIQGKTTTLVCKMMRRVLRTFMYSIRGVVVDDRWTYAGIFAMGYLNSYALYQKLADGVVVWLLTGEW